MGGVAVAWCAFADWHFVSGEEDIVYRKVCDSIPGKSG
jgi:hypothetical protein